MVENAQGGHRGGRGLARAGAGRGRGRPGRGGERPRERPRQRGGGRERAPAARVHGDPVAHRRARGPAARRPRQRRHRQHGLAPQHPARSIPIYAEFTVTENDLTAVQQHMQGGRAAGRGAAARPAGHRRSRARSPSSTTPCRKATGTVKLRATVPNARAPALARALRQRPAHPRPARRARCSIPAAAPQTSGEGPVRLRGQGRRDRRDPAGDARAAAGRPRHRGGGRQARRAGRHQRPDGRHARREGPHRGAAAAARPRRPAPGRLPKS